MKKTSLIKSTSLASLVLFSFVSNAHVEAGTLISLSLEELLTTPVSSTSLFEQTYGDASYPVSVISPDEWERFGVKNLGDLLNHMPSTIAPHVFGQSRALVVRGYLSSASTQGTAVRIDGVSINKLREGGGLMAADGFDLALFESAELIRGPGSALHGSDAFRSTLSLNTLGFGTQQTHLSVELGSSDFYAASASQTLNFEEHDFVLGGAYRELGSLDQAYRYTNNETGEIESSERSFERKNTNLLLKYRFTRDNLSVQSSIAHYAFDGDDLLGFGTVEGVGLADGDVSSYSDELTLFNLKASLDLTGRQSLDAHFFSWRNEDEFSLDLSTLPFSSFEGSETRAEKRNGARLIYKSRESVLGNFAFGYEYQYSLFDEFNIYNSNQELDTSLRVADRAEVGYVRELNSIFADGRYPISQNVSVDYGFRYDSYSDFNAQFSPRLALIYDINSREKVTLSYSTAFRSPSVIEIFGSERIKMNPDLEPEKLSSIDLNYRILHAKSVSRFSIFYSEWNDGIERSYLSDEEGGVYALHMNVGNNKGWGGEVNNHFQLDKLLIVTAASYIKSKSKHADEEYSAFPELMLDLNMGYEFDERWSVFFNNRAMKRAKNSPAFQALSSPNIYFRSDIVVAWQVQKKLSAQFVLRNIFDRKNSLPSLSAHEEGVADDRFHVSTKFSYEF